MCDETAFFAAIEPVSATLRVTPKDCADAGGYIPRKRFLFLPLIFLDLAAISAFLNYEWLYYAVHQGLREGINISGHAAALVGVALADDIFISTAISAGVLSLMYFLGYRAALSGLAKRARDARGDVPREVDISLDLNGLHVQDCSSRLDHPWTDVSDMIETGRIFRIGILGTSWIVLPKRDLDEGFVTALGQLKVALRDRTQARSAARRR
jgi:hypothetical protein